MQGMKNLVKVEKPFKNKWLGVNQAFFPGMGFCWAMNYPYDSPPSGGPTAQRGQIIPKDYAAEEDAEMHEENHRGYEDEYPRQHFHIQPTSYSELLALIMIFITAVSGVAGFLSLTNRIEKVESTHLEMKQRIDKGILPITEERMTVLAQRINDLQRTLESHDARCK